MNTSPTSEVPGLPTAIVVEEAIELGSRGLAFQHRTSVVVPRRRRHVSEIEDHRMRELHRLLANRSLAHHVEQGVAPFPGALEAFDQRVMAFDFGFGCGADHGGDLIRGHAHERVRVKQGCVTNEAAHPSARVCGRPVCSAHFRA